MSSNCQNLFNTKLNVLELYSGIGGMHFAIKNLPIDSYDLIAIDINSVANRVYNYNHFNCKQMERNINSIDENDFNKWSIDLLVMSPPCQPFTRLGLKKDLNDCRTDSFVHLMDIFPKIDKYPKHILVENVKGFETSETRQLLINTISSCGYEYKEFLLSPNQLNIPNSRLRYYLIAKHKKTLKFKSNSGQILTELPEINGKSLCLFCEQLFKCEEQTLKPVGHYLEDLNDNHFESYLLSNKILSKYFMILDIVKSDCLNTNCFTKGYSHHIEGAGSVLQTTDSDIKQICNQLNECQSDDQKIQIMRRLGLRFFTPKEISNLMCFPKEFRFPEHYSLKQMYRLLGNSVNVKVIEFLLKLLLTDCHSN